MSHKPFTNKGTVHTLTGPHGIYVSIADMIAVLATTGGDQIDKASLIAGFAKLMAEVTPEADSDG